MKNLILLLVVGVCFCACTQVQDVALFRIIENNKVGFIDSTGKIVIKPQFINAEDFSEGLASARINGTYGYIDKTGVFVIQPQYDFATPFHEGLAVVYQDGKPFYIDKDGAKPFDVHFPQIYAFNYGRAQVVTSTSKTGFINRQGKFVIDTVFTTINPFVEGLAVVEGLNHHPYDDSEKGIKENYEVGVIDTSGRFIIPYGKYKSITDLVDGYFKAEIAGGSDGFIDTKGQLYPIEKQCENCWVFEGINSGFVKMVLYKDSSFDRNYEVFVNTKGKIVINDSSYSEVQHFSGNRAFVKIGDEDYSLINKKGEIVVKNAFEDIKDGFKDGKAFAKTKDGWGLIDTTGKFILKPKFEEINYTGLIDDYIFFETPNEGKRTNYGNLIGIAKTDGAIVLQPIMDIASSKGFQNGLLECIIKGKRTYLNKAGKIIWQDKVDESLGKANIDFMRRGHFYANSVHHETDLGGFGGSANIPKSIDKTHNFPDNNISLLVKDNGSKGVNIFVTNSTKEEADFDAQDSRLYMKVQALDKKGVWRDIEYLPSSWCGNSYHILSLKPNQYWEFKEPICEGDFKTKLRIELKHFDPSDKSETGRHRKQKFVYSNEYIGSVNPGQFWRKQDYFPGGLMDPYFE